MILCPVCKHSNDEFSIKCVSCGSYIQDRVPNLDLFAMIWMIVESPSIAFKKIIIAEHKNFVLFFSLFLGIAAAFTLMWIKQSGNSFDNLFPLLLFGTAIGIIISIPLFYCLAFTFHAVIKLVRREAEFKVTYGIIGWSFVPIVLSVVFILPFELSTLGLLLFSKNPSAYEVKPLVTIILIGLDGLLVFWSLILASVGISMAYRFRFIVSMILVLFVVGTTSFLIYSIYSSIKGYQYDGESNSHRSIRRERSKTE
jgi:hypothetical protein